MTDNFIANSNTNNTFWGAVNSKYSQLNPVAVAKNMFKHSVDIGSAVVNILGSTGIAGFKFNLPKTEQVKMESEITDHYVEDNSAIQDHIARRPVTITLNGLQGDYFYSVNKIEDMLALVIPTMSLVKQFLPKLTQDAEYKYLQRTLVTQSSDNFKLNPETGVFETKIDAVYKWNFNGVDLFKLFQDLYKLKSAQTRAFYFFQALWLSNALFSVETTWRRFDDMAIQSLVPVRDNNADITDFTITFKQISRVSSYSVSVENLAGRLKQQKAEVVDKGIDKGMEVDTLNVPTD